MKRNPMKCVAAMTACVLSMGAFGVNAVSAEDQLKIVVIGDSISAGEKLAEGEKSYVQMVENSFGADLQNFSQAGNTTEDVLDCLKESEVQSALESADVIIVSVGIHDIMDPFMAKANEFMDEFGFEKFGDVFFASLEEHNLTEAGLQSYAAELTAAVKTNVNSAYDNTVEIGKQLSAYSDARIVFQNVYNPIDTIGNLDKLSDKRRFAYNSISGIVTNNLNISVNDAIGDVARKYDYEVLDVQGAFAGNAYRYVYLDELDVNPTAEGHRVIADLATAMLGEIERIKGDVTMDRSVDAKDAASVLVHASDVGAGGSGTLDEAVQAVGDVDGSGVLDAADAAKILVYASEQSAGGNPSWT